jgi:hypothetical protein
MKKKELIMTAFTKQNLVISGDYVFFQPHADNYWEDRKFVARFKHRGPVTKAKFIKTLINRYSVEEYFNRLAGAYNAQGEAPLQILMNDGILVFDNENRKFILDGKVL